MIGFTSPQNLKCITTSSSSLLCTWVHPVVINHELQSYTLSYRLLDGFDYYPGYGRTLGIATLQPSTVEYSLSGLLPYGGYIVKVEAQLLPVIGSGYSGGLYLLPTDDYLTGSATVLNVTHAEGKTINTHW